MLVATYSGGGIVPVFDVEAFLTAAIQFKPAGSGLFVTIPQGCALAESVAAPGQFTLYDGTDADLDVCRGISPFPFVINDAGQVIYGTSVTASQFGAIQQAGSMIIRGYVRTEDLYKTAGPGAVTSTAAGQLGRLISGTLTAGILAIR